MSTSSYNGNSMPIIGVSRRDGEPKSKKRRLLEATEIEEEKEMNNYISRSSIQNDVGFKKRSQQYLDHDISETVSKGNNHVTTRRQQRIDNNNRIPSEIIEITENEDEREKNKPQEDLLSMLCSSVGIDSDLTVEEAPYPTAAGMVQIRPQGINPAYYQMQRPNPNMMAPMPVPYDPRYNQVRHMYVTHPESQPRHPYSESQARHPYSYHQHRPQFIRQNSHPMYPNNNPYYQQHQHYRPRYHYMTSVGPISPTEVRAPNFIRSAPPPSYQENIQQRMRSNSQNNTENMIKPNHSYQTRHAVRIANQQEALTSNLRNSDVPKSDNQKITQVTSESSLSTSKSFESCTYSQQGLPKGHMDLVSSGYAGPERNNGVSVVASHTTQRQQDGQNMNKAITNHPLEQKQMHERYYNDRKIYPPYHNYPQNIPNPNYSPGIQAPQYRFENQRGCPDKTMAVNEKSSQNFMKTVAHNPSPINSYPPPYMNQYNVSNIERHPNIIRKDICGNYPMSPKELSQSQSSTMRQMAPHMFNPQQRLRHPAIIQNSPAYGPNYGPLSSQELATSNSMSSSHMRTSPHRLVSLQGQMSPHGANVPPIPVLSPRLHSPGGLPVPNRITPPHNVPPQCRLTPPHRLPSPQSMLYPHRVQSPQQLAPHRVQSPQQLAPHRVQSPQQLASYTTVVASNQGNLPTKPSVLHQTLPHIKEVPKQNLGTSYSQFHQKVDNYVPQNPVSAYVNKINHMDIDPKKTSSKFAFNASKAQDIEVETFKKDIKSEDGTEFKVSESTCEQDSKSLSQLFQKDIKLEANINCTASSNIVDINKDIQVGIDSASDKNVDDQKIERAYQETGSNESSKGVENKQISQISSLSASRSLNYESYNDCSRKETSSKGEIDEGGTGMKTKLIENSVIKKGLATISNEPKSSNEPTNLKRKMVDENESQNIETSILTCKNYNIERYSTPSDDSKIKRTKITEHPESPHTVDASMPLIDASMPLIEECPIVNQRKNNNYFTSFQEVFTASVKTNLSRIETLLTKSSETKLPGSISQSSSDTNIINSGVSSQFVENFKNLSVPKINNAPEKSEINLLDKDINKIKNNGSDSNSKSVEMKQLDETRPMSAPGSSYQYQDVQHIPQSRPASQPIPEINTKYEDKEKLEITSLSSDKKGYSVSDTTKSDVIEVKDDDIYKIVDEMDTNTATDNDDSIFVSRLRLVLEDLVSVPEASDLKPLLETPGALLSAMVKKGGYDPSSHTCAKQRLRQDFLSVLNLCLDPAQLVAWGWNKSSPDYILQQLVKVQQQGGFDHSVLKISATDTRTDNLSSAKKNSIPCSKSDSLSCDTENKLDIDSTSAKNISNCFKLNIPFQTTINTQKSLSDNVLPVSTKDSNTKNDLPATSNDNEINLKKNNELDHPIKSNKNPANTPTNTSVNVSIENELCTKDVTPDLGIIKTEPNIIVSEHAVATSNDVVTCNPTTISECASTESITNTICSTSTESSRSSTEPIRPATLSAEPITSVPLSTANDNTSLCSTKVLTKNITDPATKISDGSNFTATTICSTSNISISNNVVDTNSNTKPISSTIPSPNTTNTSFSSQTEIIGVAYATSNTDSTSKQNSICSSTSLSKASIILNTSDEFISPTPHKSITNTNTDVNHADKIATTSSVISGICQVPISSDALQVITNSSTAKPKEVSNISSSTTATVKSDVALTNVTTSSETPGSTKTCSSDSKPFVDVILTPESSKTSSSNLKPITDDISLPIIINNIKSTEVSSIHHSVITSTASIDSKSLSDHIINHSNLSQNDKSIQSIDSNLAINTSIINSESTSKNTEKSSPDVLNTNLNISESSNKETSIST